MPIVDWLFPKHCIGCGKLGAYVCMECLNRLPLLRNPICPMCLRSSYLGFTHPKCQLPESLDGLLSTFAYKGLANKIIKTYKYRYVSDLRDDLVELLVSLSEWGPLENTNWVVVGAPLHGRREKWRGFNQADIAEGIAQYCRWDYQTGVITRQKYTPPQMSLGRRERFQNLVGAIGCGSNLAKINGKAVLLVDDVWTTGATLRECAKILKERK